RGGARRSRGAWPPGQAGRPSGRPLRDAGHPGHGQRRAHGGVRPAAGRLGRRLLMPRIAVLQFAHETVTFLESDTTLADFTYQGSPARGEALLGSDPQGYI